MVQMLATVRNNTLSASILKGLLPLDSLEIWCSTISNVYQTGDAVIDNSFVQIGEAGLIVGWTACGSRKILRLWILSMKHQWRGRKGREPVLLALYFFIPQLIINVALEDKKREENTNDLASNQWRKRLICSSVPWNFCVCVWERETEFYL